MTSIHIIFKELNSTSKKNDKIAIIKKNADNEIFKKILVYTYDKINTNYFLKKILPIVITGFKSLDNIDDMKILDDLLEKLSKRKITGTEASLVTKSVIEQFESTSQDIIQKIIKRDLKCGFSESSINKAIPNLISTFDVALAQSYKDHVKKVWDGTTWLGSMKMDGLRCICIKENGRFKFFSRKGKPFLTLSNLLPELTLLTKDIDNIVFDGEICIMNGDKEDFKAISSEYNKKNYTIKNPMYKIFDCLTLIEFKNKISTRILSERLIVLWKLFNNISYETIDLLEQITITKESFKKLNSDVAKNGWEGLILRKDCKYKGKRSNDILKVKEFFDEEFVVDSIDIDDYTYTQKGVGQVTEKMVTAVNIYIDGKLVKGKHKVGVGSGWSIEQRKEYMLHPGNIIGKIITVQYFERTVNDHGGESLRFPTVKHIYENGRNS